MDGIRRDLESVDRLIGQALQISRELDKQEKQSVQLAQVLDHIINAARRENQSIDGFW